MRGIQFGLSDTSIQDSTDRVILPVMDGLAMAAFSTPGGTGKNYAQNRDGALTEHGAVTQNAYSKSFNSVADYIDTGLTDNTDFTVLIVSRPELVVNPKKFQPIFGNWDRTVAEGGKGGGLGVGLVAGNNGNATFLISSVPVADAGNASAITGKRENRDITGLGYNGTWRFTAMRITSSESYFKDFTKGIESPSTAMTDGYVKDNRLSPTLLISGGYLESSATETTVPGAENALTLFYRRGLSTDELATMYAWAKKYCARRGIEI
ncbi:TPA: hypothetical protein ACYENG_004772 [Klebsiella pneumoniae]